MTPLVRPTGALETYAEAHPGADAEFGNMDFKEDKFEDERDIGDDEREKDKDVTDEKDENADMDGNADERGEKIDDGVNETGVQEEKRDRPEPHSGDQRGEGWRE